jgi:uncharacterized repeat protein (TIGR01451 family)
VWFQSKCTSLKVSATLLLLLIAIVAASLSPSTPAASAFRSSGEYVEVYAADCVTPQTIFNPGDTVCAQAGNYPVQPSNPFYRRFSWMSADGSVADRSTIKGDPQADRFIIPTSGPFAQLGTWHVSTIDESADRNATAKFIVRDPRISLTDLSVSKAGPYSVLPGERVQYDLSVYNPGPDFAEFVQVVFSVPTNMTFVAMKQASGPLFDCQTPARGETGRIICTTKGLELDGAADFAVYYDVARDAKEGTDCSTVVEVTSTTEELRKEDNTYALTATVTSAAVDGPSPIEP